MTIDFLIAVLSGLASLAAGGLASTELIQKLIRRYWGRPGRMEKSYAQRLAELTTSLTKASQQVDSVLAELAEVARSRQTAIKGLESSMAILESREKELKERIQALEKTPLPVAEHFAQLLEAGERRSARRDYALFGAGVVVTTGIAILLQVFAR